MFIVRFLRFVCGYVRFQVTGVFIERFFESGVTKRHQFMGWYKDRNPIYRTYPDEAL